MEWKTMAFLIHPFHPNPTAPHSYKAERVCYTSNNGWPNLAVLVITVLTKVYSRSRTHSLGWTFCGLWWMYHSVYAPLLCCTRIILLPRCLLPVTLQPLRAIKNNSLAENLLQWTPFSLQYALKARLASFSWLLACLIDDSYSVIWMLWSRFHIGCFQVLQVITKAAMAV